MALVEDVAARLRAQVPSRTVYEHAVPKRRDGDPPLPDAYLLVRASVSGEGSERLCDTTHVVEHTLRILSVARNGDAHVAARTADVGSTLARAALRDWRPSGGQWKLRYEMGADALRDESLPQTTFTAALQYRLRATP